MLWAAPVVTDSVATILGGGDGETSAPGHEAKGLSLLTDSLTRQSEVGETCHNAGDGDQPYALASKTRRDPGDQEDARRSAHNPATASVPDTYPIGR